jgi:hypothetical protein
MHHSERVGLFVISSARASNDGGLENDAAAKRQLGQGDCLDSGAKR